MKKTARTWVGLLFVLALIVGMCGCGAKSSEAPKEEEAKDIFAGELIDAQDERIVAEDEEETMLFSSSDGTEYELKDEDLKIITDLSIYKRGYNRFKLVKEYSCEDAGIQRSFKMRMILGLL